MKPTILLIDDHAIVREGLASLLAATNKFGDIAVAEDGESAVEIAGKLDPAIVVADLIMPKIPGSSVIRMIKMLCPNAHIVVLTSSDSKQLLVDAVEAGAHSILLKSMTGEEIFGSFIAIAAGLPIIHPEVSLLLSSARESPAKNSRSPFAVLTPRELDVLVELAEGASNAKIAASLNITERTVKAHITNVFIKLDLTDRTEAVAFAWRFGLMTR